MEENKTCKNCKHYRQHYIKRGRRCDSINCGHCVYPRLKNRKPDEKACEHYKSREYKKLIEPPTV